MGRIFGLGCEETPQEDKYRHQQHGDATSPLLHRDARPPSLHLSRMHCGYLLVLLLGWWAELAASAPTLTEADLREEQSLIQSLTEVMDTYSLEVRNKINVTGMLNLLCGKPIATQRAMMYKSLATYPQCVSKLLRVHADSEVLCDVVGLTEDLLRLLNRTHPRPGDCLATLTPASGTGSEFSLHHEPLQCLDCWRRQVNALKPNLESSGSSSSGGTGSVLLYGGTRAGGSHVRSSGRTSEKL
ncbi:unnamed protein product [Ophioblennius macclurei]